MAARRRSPFFYSAVLLAAAVVCFLVGCYFMFRAGCIADLKGGSWGDPRAALEVESDGLATGLIGLLLATMGIASLPGLDGVQRVGASIGVPFVGLVLWWMMAIQAEVWGAQYCISP